MDYKKILEGVVNIINTTEKSDIGFANICTYIGENCPELTKSEDERIKKEIIFLLKNANSGENLTTQHSIEEMIAWLKKQGSEPNWCHHKVDLSNCSEEYRKAYYDGWNNCNMQYSQCKSESNDVLKCLINGMKFYYEDNAEATWGTEKFSMKVKDILSWLEKQGKQKPAWSEEDEDILNTIINHFKVDIECTDEDDMVRWLKSLKNRVSLQPKQEWSEEDETALGDALWCCKQAASIAKDENDMGNIWYAEKWIKSLRPQNWTKENKERYISCLQRLGTGNPEQPETINSKWFKDHVYPKTTWKPSDEQMEALHYVTNFDYGGYKAMLVSLYEQLKKLKEE